MKLSGDTFLVVWGMLLPAHLTMFVLHWKKWSAHLAETADRIRRFNARQGYGQGLGKGQLAEAYTTPFKTRALREFAEMNGMTLESYRHKLRESIGRRIAPLVAACCQAAATVLAIAGLAYLIVSVPVSREAFVATLTGLLLVSVVLYPLT